MRNDDRRAGKFGQRLFKDFLRFYVHVVGRFVEQQGVGPGKHQLQKRQPGLFAAAERGDAEENVVAAKQKSAQQRTHLGVSVKAVSLLHFFQHRVGRIQQLLSLIVVAEGHVVSDAQAAAVRRELLQKQAQQGGLAHAVRADNADLLAALDVQLHVFKQQALLRAGAEGFCQSLGHDHIAAGLKILFKFYLDAALCALRRVQALHVRKPLFARLRPLGQLFRAALLHAADHFLLAGKLALLVVIGSQLRLAQLALFRSKSGVIALVGAQMMVLDLEDAVYAAVEKIAVMRNDEDAAAVRGQILLQPLEHADVQVIGRLVQDQQIRLFQQQRRQSQPRPLAARKRGDLFLPEFLAEGHGA